MKSAPKLILLFLCISSFSFAQKWQLEVKSYVELRTWKLTTKAESKSNGLAGASIKVFNGSTLVTQALSTADGDFSVMVPPNAELVLEVSYQGCNSKRFKVDTRNVPAEIGTDDWKPTFNIKGGFIMVKPYPTIDYSGLQQTLISAHYKPSLRNFDDDAASIDVGLAIVSKIYAAEDVLFQNFCSTNKAGDDALRIPDCPLARMLYNKAISIIPGESYPVIQLLKVGDCLKEKEAADKKLAEEAAAKKEAEKLAAEKAAADKAAKEKNAVDKLAAEKLAKEDATKKAADEAGAKKEADKIAAEKSAADKANKDKSAAEKSAADKLAKAEVDKKNAEQNVTKDKAAADKVAAEKIAKEEAAKNAKEKAASKNKGAEEKKSVTNKKAADKAAREKALSEQEAKEEAELVAKEKADFEKREADKKAKEEEFKASQNGQGEEIDPGEKGDAKKHSRETLGLSDKYMELYKKGEDLFKMKRYEEAKPVYEEALKCKPDDKNAKTRLEQIAKLLAPK